MRLPRVPARLVPAALLATLAGLSIGAGLSASAGRAADPATDTALMMSGSNVSKNGNFFIYYTLSRKSVTIRPGDRLEYDIFIPSRSTDLTSGVDLDWTDSSTPLRDMKVRDTDGVDAHPKFAVERAKDAWYHRVIPLDAAADKTVARWSAVFEGDDPGPQAMFLDNVGIHHADGSVTWAYENGPLPADAGLDSNGGYSRDVIMQPVDRAWVTPANANTVVAQQVARFEHDKQIEEFRNDLDYVDKFSKASPEGARYRQYIEAARAQLEKVKANPNMSAEEFQAALHEGRQHLAHTHPLMQAYTGHLVGHSHIDFQWLWEWPESLEICRDTFNTVCNLMDEYPGFRFSQSSSALYKVTQEHYPAVFKRIQQKVKEGRWEVMGGRVCEGDTNMISEESHARQFLLGQRYFRKTFGKTATVGWEPDTFGHTWSMPEILKMAGIDSYYFSRGGKGQPIFWWEGPDGSKVLAFDEPASGSWYDGPLTQSTLNEMFPWVQKTGLDDILWVYGVGDHGGGVTREDLNLANAWMKKPYLPNVKFSTASQFFADLRKQDLSKVPTIDTELNPVFEGCYTTHTDMKRRNRDAENITASAETVTAFAALYGQPYPAQTFDDNWEAICFNHHHDTLPGSAIHESYVKSRNQLDAVIASSKNIAADSLQFLATFMARQPDLYNVAVFNPLGWTHTGLASIPWPNRPGPDDDKWVAVSPSGQVVPVTIIRGVRPDNPDGTPQAVFTALDVPGFGYRVFGLRPARDGEATADRVTLTSGSSLVLENASLRVTVDRNTGLVTSLFDRARNVETLAPGGAANRVEVWHERGQGMSAWTIGGYTGHTALDGPATVKVIEDTPGRATVRIDRDYQSSHITQYVSLRAGSGQVELPIWIDWEEVGTDKDGGDSLKLACDVAGDDLAASYEIPYATIQRPTDGKEVVALKSADLSGTGGGITLLNDSRSGHSAEGHTLRLSLVRASDDPDPMPDQGLRYVDMALVPHAGRYGAAQVRDGFAFNQPFLTARVAPSSDATLPMEKSFVTVDGPTVVSTVVKRAEDDPKALLVRFYEADGHAAPVRVSADVPSAPVAATQWVNFIEDPLSPKAAGPAASATLHKYEIRNAMLYTK